MSRKVVDRAHRTAYDKYLTRQQLLDMLKETRAAARFATSAEQQLWLQSAALGLHEAGASRGLLTPGETLDSPEMNGLGLASMAWGGSNGTARSGSGQAPGLAGPTQKSSFRPFQYDNRPHNVAAFIQHRKVLATMQAAGPLVESLRRTGKLPANFVTVADAERLGWKAGKALNGSVPGGQIGGDVYRNQPPVLPAATGRTWHEADVGLVNTVKRSAQPGTRVLYSNDGLLYVTTDHYLTVHPMGRWK